MMAAMTITMVRIIVNDTNKYNSDGLLMIMSFVLDSDDGGFLGHYNHL